MPGGSILHFVYSRTFDMPSKAISRPFEIPVNFVFSVFSGRSAKKISKKQRSMQMVLRISERSFRFEQRILIPFFVMRILVFMSDCSKSVSLEYTLF